MPQHPSSTPASTVPTGSPTPQAHSSTAAPAIAAAPAGTPSSPAQPTPAPTSSSPAAQDHHTQQTPAKPKRHRNSLLANRPSQNTPHYLPPDVQVQSALAQQCFRLLLVKPGRSLASIGRELGVDKHNLYRWCKAGNWSEHLRLHLNNSPESLAIQAQLEAQRSRAAQLASNALVEATIDAALVDLIEVSEDGVVRLRPGKDVQDLQRLVASRNTHVKTTQMLTGEDAANRRAAAAAGAVKVIMNAGTQAVRPEPLPVAGRVVSPVASLEGSEPKPQ